MNWTQTTLADVSLKIGSGATPAGGSNAYKETGISLIRSQNILDFQFSTNGLAFIDDDQAQELSNVTVEENDVLLNITGDSVARCCVVPITVLPARVNQHVAIIRLNPNRANYLFIFYLLQAKKEMLLMQAEIGATRKALTKGIIEKFEVHLPSLPEQKAIAAVLTSLDDKIDLLHRQNKTLESLAETLFRQWFVEEAQVDWDKGSFTDEFDFTMGQSPVGISFNESGIGVPMFQGNADFGFRFPEERVYTTAPIRLARKYDTLISVRAPVGAQNMANKECCIGRGVAAFRYRKNNNFYTYTYFKLRSLMKEIKKFDDEGTVFGSIGKSDFEALSLDIPPDQLIQRFEKDVKPINDKVIRNCDQIRTLEQLRDTLLPKLMSGEVRVAV
jgi:type I restriction enzyme, S subunit